jgi:hypothetical protein
MERGSLMKKERRKVGDEPRPTRATVSRESGKSDLSVPSIIKESTKGAQDQHPQGTKT